MPDSLEARPTEAVGARIASLTRIDPKVAPLISFARFFRPRGNLTTVQSFVLALAVVVPLLMVLIRITALPGALSSDAPGLPLVRTIGSALNELFSLSAIPYDLRDRILYLLLVPTCAFMAALTRLTLGLRILGFRSILIALALHASGIIPSVVLVTVVVAVIVAVRPRLKRMRLPYFARVSFILCVVAGIMVIAILAGPWLMRESLWSVAFFPVIVLGLLAEGIARTLDHEGARSATWRTITTLVLALATALTCQVLPLRETLLRFPELVIIQIAGILVIAEFFDLRLLQEWDAKRSAMAVPHLFSGEDALKVAVVRNRRNTDIIGHLGRPCPERYGRTSVQRIVEALREGGHTVRILEGDMSLLPELREFLPPHSKTGEPGGIVFNLAYGIQGDARYTHVPAMLEMAGIAYTSATPLGHSLALDKVVAKVLMQQAGVPTPAFCVMVTPKDDIGGLRFPLIVKPRHESSSYGLSVVKNRKELEVAVADVVEKHRQGALVEEFIAGREVNAGLLGNDPVECLPLVELDFGGRENTTLTHEDKFHKNTTDDEPKKICPARVDEALAQRIRDISIATFLACHCRDYARVDIRISESGEPYVLEINSIATLGWGGSFVLAATTAGYTFTQLICRLVEVARARYSTGGAVQLLGLAPTGPANLPIPKKPTNGSHTDSHPFLGVDHLRPEMTAPWTPSRSEASSKSAESRAGRAEG